MMRTTRSLRRTPVVRSGGVPLPFDSMSVAPRAVWYKPRRLLTSYTGPLVRVRKTTGGDTTTQHDVPYVAATGLLDEVDQAAFVGSESWADVTAYDQTSGARNITNATAAKQPIGGTTGAGVTLSSLPSADFDGTDDYWTRADALGLSGATALTLWVDCSYDTVAGLPISIGSSGAGAGFYIHNNSAVLPKVATVGAERSFTGSSLTTGRQRLIALIAAGAGLGTARLFQNGVELVEAVALNPSGAVTLATTSFNLGAFFAGIVNQNGKITGGGVWNAVLGAGDIAIINGLP